MSAFDVIGTGSRYPIGTLSEIVADGYDPSSTPSCSIPVDGRNVGCPVFKQCRFVKIRNANGDKGAGPENIGYYKTCGESGAAQGFILPCYTIVATVYDQLKNAPARGDSFSNWKWPGEKILVKGSRRKHQKADPNCQACQTKTCYVMEDFTKEVEITKHPRPNEAYVGNALVQQIKNEMANEVMPSVDYEQRMVAQTSQNNDPSLVEDAAALAKQGRGGSPLDKLRQHGT